MERARRFAQLGELLQTNGSIGHRKVRDIARALFLGEMEISRVPNHFTDLDSYGIQMVDAFVSYLRYDSRVDKLTENPGSRFNGNSTKAHVYKGALLKQLMTYRDWLQEFTVNRPEDEVAAFWHMAEEFAEAVGESSWLKRRSIVCESAFLTGAGHESLNMEASASSTKEDLHHGIDAWVFDGRVPVQLKATSYFDGAVVVAYHEKLVLPGGSHRAQLALDQEFLHFRERIQTYDRWGCDIDDAYFLIAGNGSYDQYSGKPHKPLMDCLGRIRNRHQAHTHAM